MLGGGPQAELVAASGKGQLLDVAGDGVLACRYGDVALVDKALEVHQEVVLVGVEVDSQLAPVAMLLYLDGAPYAQKVAAVGGDGLVVAVEELDRGVTDHAIEALGAWITVQLVVVGDDDTVLLHVGVDGVVGTADEGDGSVLKHDA